MREMTAMHTKTASRRAFATALLAALLVPAPPSPPTAAPSNATRAASRRLLASVPAARRCRAVRPRCWCSPKVTKAGLGIGGQYGDGVLFKGRQGGRLYNTSGASWGLQAGAQQYGYAMFLMNEKAVAALDANEGFEVGVGRASSSSTRTRPSR